jgi:hypothetical protein
MNKRKVVYTEAPKGKNSKTYQPLFFFVRLRQQTASHEY